MYIKTKKSVIIFLVTLSVQVGVIGPDVAYTFDSDVAEIVILTISKSSFLLHQPPC